MPAHTGSQGNAHRGWAVPLRAQDAIPCQKSRRFIPLGNVLQAGWIRPTAGCSPAALSHPQQRFAEVRYMGMLLYPWLVNSLHPCCVQAHVHTHAHTCTHVHWAARRQEGSALTGITPALQAAVPGSQERRLGSARPPHGCRAGSPGLSNSQPPL